MSSSLIELTANIVSSHVSANGLSSDELINEINKVYSALKKLESGETAIETETAPAPTISLKKAFQNDQITCMICGKSGFKTLARHLRQAHDMKPGQYRKQFNIPSSKSLTAKNYSEARRATANQSNLAANLEKARAVRAAKKLNAGTAKVTKPKAAKTAPKTVKPKTTKKAKA